MLEKLSTVVMIDVWFPTTDSRHLVFQRVTEPEPDVQLLIHILGLELPPQPPPRISSSELLNT